MRRFLLAQPDVKRSDIAQAVVRAMGEADVRKEAAKSGYQPPQPAAPPLPPPPAPPASAGPPPPGRPAGPGTRDVLADAMQATQDVRDKLARGVLTLEEAFERVERVIAKNRDTLTDLLRDRGRITTGETAQDYFRRQVESTAEQAGALPTAARVPLPVAARPDDFKPAAPGMRKKVAAFFEGQEADEEKREKEKEQRRQQQLRDVAAGVRTMVQAPGVGGKAAGALQIAGSGALGEGAAAFAAAAGPVGAALAIAEAVKGAIRQGAATFKEGMQEAGAVAKKVASNDGLGAALDAADKFATVAETVYPASILYAEALKVGVAGVREFNEVVGAFVRRGEQLAGYNGTLATASAQAETRQLMADIREANRLGPDYAKLIDAQSRLQTTMQDAFLPLKQFLIEKLTRAVETIDGLVLIAQDLRAGFVTDVASGIASGIAEVMPGAGVLGIVINKLVDRVDEAVKEARERRLREEKMDATAAAKQIEDLVKELDGMLIRPPFPGVWQQFPGRIGGPLFGGP
jgi:hypothetical protein